MVKTLLRDKVYNYLSSINLRSVLVRNNHLPLSVSNNTGEITPPYVTPLYKRDG